MTRQPNHVKMDADATADGGEDDGERDRDAGVLREAEGGEAVRQRARDSMGQVGSWAPAQAQPGRIQADQQVGDAKGPPAPSNFSFPPSDRQRAAPFRFVPLRFRRAFAAVSLRLRFGFASASLRFRFGFASASLRFRFGFASTSLGLALTEASTWSRSELR